MLNLAWIWFLYGDKGICLRMVLGALCCLLIFTQAMLQPQWEGLQKMRKVVREKNADLHHSMQAIQNIPPLPDGTSRALPDLGKDFGLAVLLDNQTLYFSGSSQEMLAFLVFALRQRAGLRDFHLMKKQYKMLLAVPL
jgi:hypothetical protein